MQDTCLHLRKLLKFLVPWQIGKLHTRDIVVDYLDLLKKIQIDFSNHFFKLG